MQKLSNIILGFWASYWVFAKRNTSYVPHNMMNAFTMVTSALCTFLLHEGKTYFFCIHRCISQRYLHNWPFANGEFEAPSTQPTSDIYERHANIFFLARRSPISLTKGKRQAYQSSLKKRKHYKNHTIDQLENDLGSFNMNRCLVKWNESTRLEYDNKIVWWWMLHRQFLHISTDIETCTKEPFT